MALTQVVHRWNVANRDDLEKRMGRGWLQLLTLLSIWHMRAAGRRALASLESPMLRDIGLTRQQVEQEVRKAFWQA